MLDSEIKKLRDDHQSGSIEIVLKAAEILKINNDHETIEKVRASHPDMAPLYKLCMIVKKSQNPLNDI